MFSQVLLCLEKHFLEFSPGLFRLRLGASYLEILFKLSCIFDEAVCYVHDLSLHDRIDHHGFIVYTLVETSIEDLKRLVGVEGFPQLCAIFCKVRGQYPSVLSIKMAEK